ncbi:uncharacterized protein F4822DRAFT_44594 [Hypoxylon trugodes]|uniref:uncharacterized protein n=1 Tax=Hypoxylon trugodes TaxID=326681 RepID=UPI00218E699B|nr:uncharacterized protein F4822DRAFT_44594 [Hypoxylon trugodes]KAI1394299.1 hypothetical protein F4822DRAFT_44594 [Hypoxylon trugodes]
MVRRSSSDYSYIDGYSQGRTPNDVVWGSTKAKDLVSSVRFSWDNKHQKIFFVRFLAKEGLNYKNADVTPLLRTLNLDGYEDIKNFNGDNVHDIIVEKVRRKLASTVSELDPDFLFKASLG